jgi:hypothetical protein
MRRTDWRWLLPAILLTGLLAGGAMAEKGESSEGAPKLVISEKIHDLGRIYEPEKYEHTFIIKNTGTADLVIDRVQPG